MKEKQSSFGISPFHENTVVIPKLNLNIPGGKITIVVGANGCGKSTMIKTAAGILRPKEGERRDRRCKSQEMAPKETAK